MVDELAVNDDCENGNWQSGREAAEQHGDVGQPDHHAEVGRVAAVPKQAVGDQGGRFLERLDRHRACLNRQFPHTATALPATKSTLPM